MSGEGTTWGSYEEVARYLLGAIRDELGLERVEGKQSLPGKSGTSWELDAKGVRGDDGAIVVIECRRYTTSRLKQKDIAALACQIDDVNAAGGIVVTPIGLQKGAEILAQHKGISLVHLNAEATNTDFVLKFLERVVIGVSAHFTATATMTAEVQVVRIDETPR